MTEKERMRALAEAKQQIAELKATIKQLNHVVVEQPKLYDQDKFKEELKYLSTLINPKYLIMIEKKASKEEISSRATLQIIDKQSTGYTRCAIGLTMNKYSYYDRDFMPHKQYSPNEFCNEYLTYYSYLEQNQHTSALSRISNACGINMPTNSLLWFGLTKPQAKHIKKIMEKYDNAPTAKIAIIKYILDNFDKIDKRLGINVTEQQIKNSLKVSLKAIEKMHNENLKDNVYFN